MSDPKLIDTGSSGTGWSYYSRFVHCPQDWAFTYRLPEGEERPSPADAANPLKKGTILGTGLAHHYALKLGQDVYEPKEAMRIKGEELEMPISLMADLRIVYDEYARLHEYEKWRPIAVERLVKGKIAGEPYTMRLDLEVEDERGRHLMVDHKSSSRVSVDLATKYTLSGQFIGAYIAGRKIPRFGGIVINAIPSVADRMKFLRLPLPPAPAVQNVEAFGRTIKYIADNIRKLEGTPYNQYPKALSETSCVTQYGVCPHFERCRMGV